MVMNEHNTAMNWNVYATMVFPEKPRIQQFKIKNTVINNLVKVIYPSKNKV